MGLVWWNVMRFRCDTPNSGPSDFLHHIPSRSCIPRLADSPRSSSPDTACSSSYTLSSYPESFPPLIPLFTRVCYRHLSHTPPPPHHPLP